MAENDLPDPTDKGMAAYNPPSKHLQRLQDWDRAVVTALGALRLHYPGQPMTPEQERIFWADYLTDLAGWNPRMITESCARWRRSPERFFPNPGQLLELCRKVAAERPKSSGIRYRDALGRDGWRPPTDEEKKRVADLVEGFRKRIAGRVAIAVCLSVIGFGAAAEESRRALLVISSPPSLTPMALEQCVAAEKTLIASGTAARCVPPAGYCGDIEFLKSRGYTGIAATDPTGLCDR